MAGMMNIGKLGRRIAIERETETVKPSGDVVKAWAEVATVWAEVLQSTATEYFTGMGEVETGAIIFRIRWLHGITTADRIAYNSQHYGLKEIKELGRRDALELRAEVIR